MKTAFDYTFVLKTWFVKGTLPPMNLTLNPESAFPHHNAGPADVADFINSFQQITFRESCLKGRLYSNTVSADESIDYLDSVYQAFESGAVDVIYL